MNHLRNAVASLLVSLGLLTLGAARAEVAAAYAAGTGSPVPSTAAGGTWTLNNAAAVNGTTVVSAAVTPDGATGLNAWRMLDNSTAGSAFAFWSKGLNATQLSNAVTYGWRLSANVRVVDPVASNAGTLSDVLLFGNNAGKRWILFFDIDASGNLTTNLVGSTTITVATGASATAYHLHEMVYSPTTQTVEYFVDGVSKATGYAGTTGTFNGVQWGNGSSAGRGDSYWNTVTLTVNDPPPPTVPPVITLHPVSQNIAVGNSITLSGAATNATSYQWYKNTTSIPGATTANLTLTNVTTAEAGDYWLRATNAYGNSETTTAAVGILTAGTDLQLTEFLAENDHGLRDSDGQQLDWIELHNPTTAALSTTGWALTDDPAVPAKWLLPSDTIPAGGYRIIFASGKNRTVPTGEWHTNFKLGNAAGGYLALVRADLSVAQSYTNYPEQRSDLTYGLTTTGVVKYFRQPTPGLPNADGITMVRPEPVITPPAGTFSGSLSVSIVSEMTGGMLRYTTNGQQPTFDSPAYSAALNLSATTTVRASMIFPGERYGTSSSNVYLRLANDVAAFTSPLPIVVLHNFGAGAVPGIASNGPNGDGSGVVEVARQPITMTIIDAAAGNNTLTSPVVTSTRAGMKRRGSSSFNFARQSYALETWGELDGETVDMPLLGMPADSDWVLYAPTPTQFDDPLIHNSLIYELARQAGYPAPRTRFVEVFLNTGGGDVGMANALGLYLLVEKPKRGANRVSFDYLSADGSAGGWMINVDRMDSLPVGSALGSITPRHFHTAGPDTILQTEDDNIRGYQGPAGGSGIAPPRDDMPNYYHSFYNFDSPGGWSITAAQRAPIQTQMRALDTALYGANYTSPTLGYPSLLDSTNWAQHLALSRFAKNQDAVVLSTFIYRESPTSKIKFGPLWDFDRAFASNPTNSSAAANPTWAHDRLYYPRLMTDPEFVQTYIDAWQTMRRGPFATANMLALVDAQSAEITSTVAARSGTSGAQWATDLATLKTWLTDRGNTLDALYTQPPVMSQNGGTVSTGFSLTLTAPVGNIYYTTDGTDPRAEGGGLSAGAVLYAGGIPITSNSTIFARAQNASAWSGPTVAAFFPQQNLQTLRVTELMYNPPGAPGIDGDNFEFIELQNTGNFALELGGLSFAGITFTFPAGTTLAAGSFYVLARNAAQFTARYGGTPHGVYTGKLDNGGETISLLQGTELVWSFEYGDDGAWPTQADNGGLSLQRPDPTLPGYDAATWTASTPSPGINLSLADTDADGLPDYWEMLYGVASAATDEDADGASNLEEFIAGTNPLDPQSRFVVNNTSAADGSMQLDFLALSGRGYSVETSSDLSASWQKLVDFPAEPTTRMIHFTLARNSSRAFVRITTPLVLGTALLAAAPGPADVTVNDVFSDHMVLQRDVSLPVWGTAAVGHRVTVEFAGQAVSTLADADGKWSVQFPKLAASKVSRAMTIRADGEVSKTINDVLVGEVWICAGQSNMEFRCDQEATWATEQTSATLPEVRLRNMGYAGQGHAASGYSAALVARQTPASFYNPSTWTACTAASAAPFSAVGYFFGKEMRNALDVPIGLINLSVGGSPAEAWIRRAALAGNASFAPMLAPNWTSNNTNLEPWCNGRALVQLGTNIGSAPGDDVGPNHSFKPSFLWDSGPARLAPFAMGGVLWYQGESNALSHIGEAGVANPQWRVDQHEALFPLLVNDWRAQWGQGNFPFLTCQLSSISEASYDSDFWPQFRDQQRRHAATLSNVGLAVTSDIGNASNVHPTNKHDVGKRLVNWARRNVYQDTSVLVSPLPTTATRSGSTVTIHFSDAGTALATSNAAVPASLELAGADGVFAAATATISGPDLIVTSASVTTPMKVRYAWQPFSQGNLVNSAGLPCSTFLLSVTP